MSTRTKIAATTSVAAASLALLTTAATAAPAEHAANGAYAGNAHGVLLPGHLLLSRTNYTIDPSAIKVGTTVLPGCTLGTPGDPSCTAVADAGYPEVFNNEAYDPSFGITTPISLDTITPSGHTMGTLAVPTDVNGDHLVTSFPSKSEIGLNLSTGGDALTFMGYVAPVGALDISNANTPAAVDPTNPVPIKAYRAVAEVRPDGAMSFTETNAYSGNNGRAAILDSATNEFFMSGNAGNGGNPEPASVVAGAGAQMTAPSTLPESAQTPGQPTPAGTFSITQLGYKADKIGKDTNFRGLTIHDNVVYLTKGSGNGINTVYFINTDPTNKCTGGVGLPTPGAALPTAANRPAAGYPMCILKGFNTALAKVSTTSFPFGLWFANDTTLYVADEGSGSNTYDPATGTFTTAAASTTAGLQKWVLQGGTWTLAYTIQNGLDLGTPYTVAGYPTGDNAATGLPWAPATGGLRNLTGRVNDDGTVTVWAVTSTVSGATDEGADPNRLVSVTDSLAATSPAGETFKTVRTARSGEALRGIAYVPGS